jgi:ATP-binding cassette subfamily B multidrug efflux pump
MVEPQADLKNPEMSGYRVFRRIYPYLWQHRYVLLAGIFFLILTNYMEVRLAVLVGSGTDILRNNLGPLYSLQKNLLNVFLLLVVGLGLGMAVARFWMRRLIIGVSRHVEYRFRNDFFNHLLCMSSSFYDRYRTGDLMSRATSDMDAVRVVLGPAIMYIANTLAILPMTIHQMISISPRLGIICMLPLLCVAPFFYLFKRHIHERFQRTQELMSDISSNIQECLSGIRVIKSSAREEKFGRLFDEVSSTYVTANMALARVNCIFMPMLGLIVFLSVLLLLGVGGIMIIRGSLTHGELVTFFLLLMSSVWPIIAVGWVLSQIERGSASMKRIEFIFQELPEVEVPNILINPPVDVTAIPDADRLRGHVVFRDLTFSYSGNSDPVLREINLEIEPGQVIGLTGPVGCGKSTFAALLARRYNPPPGTLMIDGRDILDWPIGLYRRQVGMVDQEPFLFSDTIASNIAYGLDPYLSGDGGIRHPESAAGKQLRQASEIAQVHEQIESFPWGYETILGERGINLSGGQRQRTALARALAGDPRLLILDDALAAVDTHTEEAILRGLKEYLGGRTTILISHRISTVSLAHRIAYLENGCLLETGTHDELLRKKGHYWRLAKLQQLAEEIERTA